MLFVHRLFWAAVVLSGPSLAGVTAIQVNNAAATSDLRSGQATGDLFALRAVVADVLSAHTDVQAARASAAAAEAASDGAAQPLFNPELEISSERTDISTNTVGVTQTLDWHDKGAARARVAELELVTARADARLAEYDTAAATLLALARFHSARETAVLRDEQAQLLQRVAELADQRLSAGDIGQAETDFIHVGAEQAANAAVDAQAALVEAQAALSVATQSQRTEWPMPPPAFQVDDLPVRAELAALEQPELSPAALAMLDTLPRVASARARADASEALVRVAAKERRADPTLGLTLGREDEENLVGVSISIPLYVRNTYAAVERRAHAEAAAVQAELERARKAARIEWLQAASRFRLAATTWQRSHDAKHRTVSEQLDTLERQWRAGDLTTSDYWQQSGEYLGAQIAAIDIRARAWEAWIQWLAASGKLAQWLP